jgi:hypothetical protein
MEPPRSEFGGEGNGRPLLGSEPRRRSALVQRRGALDSLPPRSTYDLFRPEGDVGRASNIKNFDDMPVARKSATFERRRMARRRRDKSPHGRTGGLDQIFSTDSVATILLKAARWSVMRWRTPASSRSLKAFRACGSAQRSSADASEGANVARKNSARRAASDKASRSRS